MWDPTQYGRFGDERGRAFFDLVARVGAERPDRVADLGCGTGALTATLLERWPDARIEAVDSSPEMIAEAAVHAVPGRLVFSLCDIREWRPDGPIDVIVSNAVLQWIPGHIDLLPRWVESLAPGGWVAFQVPGNGDAPVQTALAELRVSDRWRERLGHVHERVIALEPGDYLERLAGLDCDVDVWATTYHHVLHGPDPVLEWARGTALRPVLRALDASEQAEFCAAYGARLRDACPARSFGTVLPFRRIFAVARRPD
jgi:trans-aconitate 2-methyltransferase